MPFFSPDGKSVGFITSGPNLRTIPLDGGPPQVIWKGENRSSGWLTGATWTANGIVIGRWPQAGLWLVPEPGTAPRALSPVGNQSDWYLWPEALPGAKGVLFTKWSRGRDSKDLEVLVPSGSRARYVPTGHLLYESERQLMAVAFNVDTLRVEGRPVALFGGLPNAQWWGTFRASTIGRSFDVSNSGTLVYSPAPPAMPVLVWKDRRGHATPLPLAPWPYLMPTLSPDGRYITDTTFEGPRRSIWIGRADGASMARLTFGDDDCYTLFSRDGTLVYFTSLHEGQYRIFRIPADRSARPERVTDTPGARATSWSPDGSLLLYNYRDATDNDVFVFKEGRLRAVVQTPYRERNATFSPDGQWIAYESNESGPPDEVYVQAYPSGRPLRISVGGGAGPIWNPRGGELFYQGARGVMSVRIADGRATSPPVLLFSHRSEFRDWDVAPDGERFLIVEGADASRFPLQINVNSNWFEELKAKVPAGK
jgi:hypothetical protein